MADFNPEKFRALVGEGRYDEAMAAVDAAVAAASAEADKAEALRLRADLNWKLGRRARAISDYEAAVAADPDSPARQSLDMAREVMDFFNHDLYNP